MHDNPDAAGFSADTEILTRGQGWITFDQLTCLDEIATRSPDGRFEWQHPESADWRSFDGGLVRFHGRSMDLLVGHGNRMPCKADARGPEQRLGAGRILAKAAGRNRQRSGITLVATSSWDAPSLGEKVFPGVRRAKMGPRPQDLRMTGDQYAGFMGMYIAEGHTAAGAHFHKVGISQMEHGKGYAEYRALLTDICGREPGRGGHTWQIYSRPLYEYLHPLGLAASKRLPAEVMCLARCQLAIFWRHYFLGDGCLESHRAPWTAAECVATASPQLAGQLQEIVQKLGWSASVRCYRNRPNPMVTTEGYIYKIRVRQTLNPSCAVDAVRYSGMLGSVRVANEVVYVRRDGHPAWSGT